MKKKELLSKGLVFTVATTMAICPLVPGFVGNNIVATAYAGEEAEDISQYTPIITTVPTAANQAKPGAVVGVLSMPKEYHGDVTYELVDNEDKAFVNVYKVFKIEGNKVIINPDIAKEGFVDEANYVEGAGTPNAYIMSESTVMYQVQATNGGKKSKIAQNFKEGYQLAENTLKVSERGTVEESARNGVIEEADRKEAERKSNQGGSAAPSTVESNIAVVKPIITPTNFTENEAKPGVVVATLSMPEDADIGDIHYELSPITYEGQIVSDGIYEVLEIDGNKVKIKEGATPSQLEEISYNRATREYEDGLYHIQEGIPIGFEVVAVDSQGHKSEVAKAYEDVAQTETYTIRVKPHTKEETHSNKEFKLTKFAYYIGNKALEDVKPEEWKSISQEDIDLINQTDGEASTEKPLIEVRTKLSKAEFERTHLYIDMEADDEEASTNGDLFTSGKDLVPLCKNRNENNFIFEHVGFYKGDGNAFTNFHRIFNLKVELNDSNIDEETPIFTPNTLTEAEAVAGAELGTLSMPEEYDGKSVRYRVENKEGDDKVYSDILKVVGNKLILDTDLNAIINDDNELNPKAQALKAYKGEEKKPVNIADGSKIPFTVVADFGEKTSKKLVSTINIGTVSQEEKIETLTPVITPIEITENEAAPGAEIATLSLPGAENEDYHFELAPIIEKVQEGSEETADFGENIYKVIEISGNKVKIKDSATEGELKAAGFAITGRHYGDEKPHLEEGVVIGFKVVAVDNNGKKSKEAANYENVRNRSSYTVRVKEHTVDTQSDSKSFNITSIKYYIGDKALDDVQPNEWISIGSDKIDEINSGSGEAKEEAKVIKILTPLSKSQFEKKHFYIDLETDHEDATPNGDQYVSGKDLVPAARLREEKHFLYEHVGFYRGDGDPFSNFHRVFDLDVRFNDTNIDLLQPIFTPSNIKESDAKADAVLGTLSMPASYNGKTPTYTVVGKTGDDKVYSDILKIKGDKVVLANDFTAYINSDYEENAKAQALKSAGTYQDGEVRLAAGKAIPFAIIGEMGDKKSQVLEGSVSSVSDNEEAETPVEDLIELKNQVANLVNQVSEAIKAKADLISSDKKVEYNFDVESSKMNNPTKEQLENAKERLTQDLEEINSLQKESAKPQTPAENPLRTEVNNLLTDLDTKVTANSDKIAEAGELQDIKDTISLYKNKLQSKKIKDSQLEAMKSNLAEYLAKVNAIISDDEEETTTGTTDNQGEETGSTTTEEGGATTDTGSTTAEEGGATTNTGSTTAGETGGTTGETTTPETNHTTGVEGDKTEGSKEDNKPSGNDGKEKEESTTGQKPYAPQGSHSDNKEEHTTVEEDNDLVVGNTKSGKNLVATKVDSLSEEKLNSITDTKDKAEVERIIKGDHQVYEVTVKGDVDDENEVYELAIPYDTSKEVAKVVHIKDNGSVQHFEKGNFTLKDGKVHIKTLGLSPVVIEYAQAQGDKTVSKDTQAKAIQNQSKAPKTGDTSENGSLLLLGLSGLLGAMAARIKKVFKK